MLFLVLFVRNPNLTFFYIDYLRPLFHSEDAAVDVAWDVSDLDVALAVALSVALALIVAVTVAVAMDQDLALAVALAVALALALLRSGAYCAAVSSVTASSCAVKPGVAAPFSKTAPSEWNKGRR